MAELIIESLLYDCDMRKGSTIYSEAWAAEEADYVDSGLDGGSPTVAAGQFRSALGNFYINRPGLFFDTSVLSAIDVQSVTLSLFITQSRSANRHFDLVVQSGMPLYPHQPVFPADYWKELYSGNFGSISSQGLPQWPAAWVQQWKDIPLDMSLLNREGITKLVLRSSWDIEGSSPGDARELEERMYFYRTTTDPDYDRYRPRLIVEYPDGEVCPPCPPSYWWLWLLLGLGGGTVIGAAIKKKR